MQSTLKRLLLNPDICQTIRIIKFSLNQEEKKGKAYIGITIKKVLPRQTMKEIILGFLTRSYKHLLGACTQH